MTKEEIINGLKFTIEMFLLDPSTGEIITEPRNNMDKITIDACGGAIELLEQAPKTGHWIYDNEYSDWFDVTYECSCCKRAIIVPYEIRNEVYKDYPYCHCGARMLPQPYKAESEE